MEARDQKHMSTIETSGLSCKPGSLPGEVARRCPWSVCAIERIGDLRRLFDSGLVTVKQTRICATHLGMEALWYHSLH